MRVRLLLVLLLLSAAAALQLAQQGEAGRNRGLLLLLLLREQPLDGVVSVAARGGAQQGAVGARPTAAAAQAAAKQAARRPGAAKAAAVAGGSTHRWGKPWGRATRLLLLLQVWRQSLLEVWVLPIRLRRRLGLPIQQLLLGSGGLLGLLRGQQGVVLLVLLPQVQAARGNAHAGTREERLEKGASVLLRRGLAHLRRKLRRSLQSLQLLQMELLLLLLLLLVLLEEGRLLGLLRRLLLRRLLGLHQLVQEQAGRGGRQRGVLLRMPLQRWLGLLQGQAEAGRRCRCRAQLERLLLQGQQRLQLLRLLQLLLLLCRRREQPAGRCLRLLCSLRKGKAAALPACCGQRAGAAQAGSGGGGSVLQRARGQTEGQHCFS